MMKDSPTRRGTVVDDHLDVPLEDAELLAEVELTTNLMIAASASSGHLTQADIDGLLGVTPSSIPTQQIRDIPRP